MSEKINNDATSVQAKLEVELQARDQFFSAVAHELRNPLNALHLTLAGLIRAHSGATPLSADQIFSRINRATIQVSRLAKLVDDMLDVARISSGRLQLQIEEFDAVPILAEVVERLKDPANPSQISRSMPLSLVLRCDRARFEQIARNLLSNALLYGNHKSIEVSLKGDDSTVHLEVADHGIGIPEADQERIFERFQKLSEDGSNVRFGLGLWIAREVVCALHGKIGVSSSPGVGSTFLVELPRLNLVGTRAP